jgi:NAD(P)-dependent dehydrogenase (short-subunit alcohol dehydrogenase family)
MRVLVLQVSCMARTIPFGARSTADQVLAGVDLTRKRILVTGCNSGIGFETMNALAANGAHVIGLARTGDSAQAACNSAGSSSTPIACDLTDLESVEAAADSILRLPGPLDAVIANAGIANLPTLQTRYGVELQFLVNHIAHFALVNRLVDSLRSGSGRIVIVSSDASITQAPAEGSCSTISMVNASMTHSHFTDRPNWRRRFMPKSSRVVWPRAAYRSIRCIRVPLEVPVSTNTGT